MTAILDASALLAYLQDEPGCDAVEAVIADSAISSVNWSEVIQKSVANGVDVIGIGDELQALGLVVIPFSAEQAEIAGCLWQQTRQKGLSLADRACLATAQEMAIPVLTADHVWVQLGLPMDIRVIR